MSAYPAINPYPDEPHPDDRTTWKRWWVKKFFDPEKPLFLEDLQWIDSCRKETKGRWPNKTETS